MRTCVVPSCAKGVSGYSNLCNKHRINDRRNGSPLQRVVKASEVAKVAKHIERWIKGRSNSQVILDGMHKAWLGIIGDAKAELTRLERGGATHRDHIRAYSDVAKVGSEVKWETIALSSYGVWPSAPLLHKDKNLAANGIENLVLREPKAPEPAPEYVLVKKTPQLFTADDLMVGRPLKRPIRITL